MNTKKKLSFIGVVIVCIVGWSCGEQVIGQALVDAGSLLTNSGTAHGQTNCTWKVRRFSLFNGNYYSSEVTIDSGWEPFATDTTAVLARRCQ